MVIDKTIFQTNAPSHSDVIWAKPEEDKITLHMYNRGKWVPVSGAIDQNVKKTYPVDPSATLLTKTTRYSDIVTDDLINAVKSELNIDHDAPYSDEELQAMNKALLSKINDNKYKTKDHGMATATAFDVDTGNLVFTCDDGTLFIMPKNSNTNYEFQRKEPFGVTVDGVQSAAIITQAKVLGINIDKYLPNVFRISMEIDNAWGSYNQDEYNAAIGKVSDELKSMQYVTEEHGSAELKVIGGDITEGANFLFKCEDGTIIEVLGSLFVKEHIPAPDYTRFQLINDLYGNGDWEYDQNAPYVIVDTKDTEGKITDELLRSYVIKGIPDLTTLHNYTDTIYMPAEAILFKIDDRIGSCSSFFKLHWVNKDNIGIPSDIQAIIDAADEVDSNFNQGSGTVKSAPTLKTSGGGSGSNAPVSIWKTTVKLSDNTLAYIFMTISTAANRSTPFGIATISMSPLHFSDNIDYIPTYGQTE